LRIAAIADIHCRIESADLVEQLVDDVRGNAELLILAGDLTDNGRLEEGEVLLAGIETIDVPVVAVLGNHDHEDGNNQELADLLASQDIFLLDGSICEIDGVGFVGAKGFCGGFDNMLVQPFGEAVLKTFIQASINEAVILENALARLTTERKIAVMHFAPIKDTLVGESPELFPFLGCSRLANAIDRHGVDLVVHGHAHHGSPFGRTPGNIPVYNVSRHVQMHHNQRPVCFFDI
jgi:uncharacterized protein